MKLLSLIGRLAFGGFFVMSGLNHFLRLQQMTGYAASKNVPMPTAAVMFSGLLLVVGGVLVLLGYRVRFGAILILLFLIPVSLMMHNFWAIADAQAKQMEMSNFMKNMALAGAALMIASVRFWPLGLEKAARVAQPQAE